MTGGRIDVHHGLEKVAGAPLPPWSAERSLRVMDDNRIATALLSLSAPGVHFGDDAEAVELARACNDFNAELAHSNPGRFGSFAVLPMPLVESSCVEAVRALDVLKADGIVLLGSTRGVFLGDPSLDELSA